MEDKPSDINEKSYTLGGNLCSIEDKSCIINDRSCEKESKSCSINNKSCVKESESCDINDKSCDINKKPHDELLVINDKLLVMVEKPSRSALFVEKWSEGLPGSWSPVACMSPNTGLSPRSSLGSEYDASALTDVSTDSLLETSSFDTDADVGEGKRKGSCDSAVVEDATETILDMIWMTDKKEVRSKKKRSLSLITPPDIFLLEIPEKIPEIPEVVVTHHDVVTVVVTDHDAQQIPEEEDISVLARRHRSRLLQRSNSSPGVLLPLPPTLRRASCQQGGQQVGGVQAEEPPINNNINYAVTLDDIARIKMGKKKKISNAGLSCGSESVVLNDDSWSYTNCSSSKSGDTESLLMSDIEAGKETETETEGDSRETRSKLSGIKKASKWKKLRNMVRWTPFIMTYRNRKYPWIQLSGHPGNFVRGVNQGTILKIAGEQEEKCYRLLNNDELQDDVPHYYQTIQHTDGKKYLELQCCLSDFVEPNVMDIKMGVRTFRETEAKGGKLRPDMYKKMVDADKTEPTDQEHLDEAITKYRYLTWRDTASSSESLGFRIEGTTIRGKSSKDYKQMKSSEHLIELFNRFFSNQSVANEYIDRLKMIKQHCLSSSFFGQHELIGTSLLLVHDMEKAGVWMIDFEKTTKLPPSTTISHAKPWVLGSHEDGYLIGLNSLIQLFTEVSERFNTNQMRQSPSLL